MSNYQFLKEDSAARSWLVCDPIVLIFQFEKYQWGERIFMLEIKFMLTKYLDQTGMRCLTNEGYDVTMNFWYIHFTYCSQGSEITEVTIRCACSLHRETRNAQFSWGYRRQAIWKIRKEMGGEWTLRKWFVRMGDEWSGLRTVPNVVPIKVKGKVPVLNKVPRY